MPKNPNVEHELQAAKQELERLRAEKLRLYPPNPHPFVERDRYPGDYTPEQIEHRKQLIARIEELERRVQHLQDRLYSG